MSHVTTIEANEKYDLPTLKQMCKNQGWEWMEGQKTYKWFGKHVGDYPLPEGFTVDDMGKCSHAIKVPGAKYEIGVVKKGKDWKVIYDFWDKSLKEKLCADVRDKHGTAGLLNQAYGIAKAQIACKKKNRKWTVSKVDERPGWQKLSVSMGGW